MSGYIGNIPTPQATQSRQSFTATASQTTFATVGYTAGFIDVYLNGVHLLDGTDYTATNGSDIVLTTGAALNDVVEFVAYETFSVLDQSFTGTTTTEAFTTTGAFTSLGIDDNATSTAMTLDASGNLLVGKAAAGVANNGFETASNGNTLITRTSGTANVNTVLTLNRLNTDGNITEFKKDGVEVGSIGANAGSPYFTTTAGGFRIAGNGALQPATSTGAVSDALEDLGSTAARWRDLYLSGGVYLGGTGAANKLDDYEEGTWTPVISDGTDNATSDVAVATYTKIGNHVHVQGRIRITSFGAVNGALRITGLPFNSKTVSNNFSAMTIGRAAGLNLTAGTTVCGDLRSNVDHVLLVVWDAALGNTGLQDTEFSSDGDISFSMNYLSV